MDDLEAVARAPLFEGLDVDDLRPLAPSMRRRAHPKGSFVWLQGDSGDVLELVVEGRVKTARVAASGEELVIQWVLPGELCGLPAALAESAKRMTQGEAVEDTVVIAFDAEAFMRVLERHPRVMRRVLDIMARTTRAALATLTDVGYRDVRGRVAQKLLDLADLYGEQTPDGVRIGIRVSQRALAGMVAASREKVNRALAHLAAAGAIRQQAGSITILAPERLRDPSGPDR